jgi:hypothetical protein
VTLVRVAVELVVAPELQGNQHICIPTAAVRLYPNGLGPKLYIVGKPSLERGSHGNLEVVVSKGSVGKPGFVCCLLFCRQPRKVAEKTRVQLDNNIDVAVSVDVCVVAIGALKEDLVLLVSV